MKIEDDIVTSRIYQEFKIKEPSFQREIIDSYTETSDDLESHEKGARPLTIDDLYNSCASKYLVADEKDNTIYFEAEIDGLMTLCGFVPKGCMDDCFRGIRINSLNWID